MLNATINFLFSTIFSHHYYPRNPDLHHRDHGRQPPNNGPITIKPQQYPHECLRYRQQCWQCQFGRHSSHNHCLGWAQVSSRWHKSTIHLHRKTNDNHSTINWCAEGVIWADNDGNNATTSRKWGGYIANNTTILWAIMITADGIHTQQLTRRTIK